MGYTLDLYKSLLFKELFGENYEQKLKNGNLPPVNEEKMQDAIKKVYKQLDDLGPNLEDTEGAFKEFVEGSENPELYELFGHDKGAAGKYANGRKVEQFKKNREAFMKMAVEPLVRQEIEWVSAAGRLGISEEKRHSFCTHLDRWTKNLMHTDGSPESAKHNDEVAALFALCYKDMTEEEFKNFRRKHYEDLRKNGKLDISDDDIKLKLDEEVKKAPERILNITKDEVKDAPEDVKKLPGIISDIFGGNADNPENGKTLEGAYKAVGNRNIYLSWVSKDVAETMKNFGLPDEKNLSQDEILDWQGAGGQASYQLLGELAANPYYTLVEPYKVYKYGKNTMRAPREDASPETILKQGFLENAGITYALVEGNCVIERLSKYAVRLAGEKLNDRVGHFRIYQQTDPVEGGKIERTVILKVQDMENGEPVCVTEAGPEELANEGLKEEVDRISKWSKKNKTSRQFEAMRDALIALNAVKLTDESALIDYKKFEKKLDELKKAVDAYLEKKANENTKRWHHSSSYEKERVEFAKGLKEFTERKKKELGYAEKFMITRQSAAQAEKDMQGIDEKKNDKRYAKLSGLAYMIEKGKEEQLQKKKLEEKQKKEKDKLAKEREKERRTDLGRGYRKQLDDLKKNIGQQDLDKNDEHAQSKVKAYMDDRQAGYDAAKKDSDKVSEAKKMLAAKTIEEYLVLESKQEKDPADWSMHELVNAGKIKEMTEFIMSSEYFAGNLARDEKLTDKEYVEGCKKNRAFFFHASKDIVQCMQLAENADKSKQNQVDKFEDIRTIEEIKEDLKEAGKEANVDVKGQESVRSLISYNKLIEAEQKENGKFGAGRKRSNTMTKTAKKETIESAQKNANEANNKENAPQPLGGKGIGPKRKSKRENE